MEKLVSSFFPERRIIKITVTTNNKKVRMMNIVVISMFTHTLSKVENYNKFGENVMFWVKSYKQ